MTPSEIFLFFITNDTDIGFYDIGVDIAKHLSAKDLASLMQVNVEFEEFVLENSKVGWLFIKKAQVDCASKVIKLFEDNENSDGDDPLNYILDCLEHEQDKRKMKVAVMQFKLQLQFDIWKDLRNPCDLSHHPIDEEEQVKVSKEFKKLASQCTDKELKCIHSYFGPKYLSNLCVDIYNSLKDKNLKLDRHIGKTALHLLSASEHPYLEEWIRSLPPEQRCPADDFLRTPLHWVLSRPVCNAETVKILCKYMSQNQIGLQDCVGRTALHLACAKAQNRTEVVQVLCQNMTKDQIGLQDDDCKTAFDVAREHTSKGEHSFKIVQIMKRYLRKNADHQKTQNSEKRKRSSIALHRAY